MAMVLVLVSIVTGLSLLDGDVTAAGLTPQQLAFLRQWKLRHGDTSPLRVYWQPATATSKELDGAQTTAVLSSSELPRRKSRLSNRFLKRGYPTPAAAAPAPAPAPPPPPRVFVISAPAPQPATASKPQQSNPHAQPQQMMSGYPPSPHQQPHQQQQPVMMSYGMPHGAPMMMMSSESQSPSSYRVIFIQQPQPAEQPPAQSSYPPPAPASSSGYPPAQPQHAQPMMMSSYPMPSAASSDPHAAASMPQTPTAVQSSYSVSQTQAQQGR